ncbi:MAG: hypothetical protein AABW81_04300 [Nanoarchaeota archaeon]
MKIDIDKLKCFSLSPKHNQTLHRIPLTSYMEKIILGKDDEVNIPQDNVRLLLDKNVLPPMIYVHVNNEFAAQYTYYDKEFSKRSNLEIEDME